MVRFTNHHSGTEMPRRGPSTPSLDDLIGAGEQRLRHGEAERLGGLEVDHELEFDRPLYGEIGRLRPFQDFVDICGRAPTEILDRGDIGDEPPMSG